ncbi:MAG: heme-binding domain-containing protein [Bacteroidales bacterium]
MKLAVKILLALAIIFVVIQFFRPERNKSEQAVEADISIVISVPGNVQTILKNACYDCHSNNTKYPWYYHIQPAGWYLANHIKDAKEELNFNEFGSYTQRRQLSKMEEVGNVISGDLMPLPSYRLLHKKARLSPEEKKLLITWAEESKTGFVAE